MKEDEKISYGCSYYKPEHKIPYEAEKQMRDSAMFGAFVQMVDKNIITLNVPFVLELQQYEKYDPNMYRTHVYYRFDITKIQTKNVKITVASGFQYKYIKIDTIKKLIQSMGDCFKQFNKNKKRK